MNKCQNICVSLVKLRFDLWLLRFQLVMRVTKENYLGFARVNFMFRRYTTSGINLVPMSRVTTTVTPMEIRPLQTYMLRSESESAYRYSVKKSQVVQKVFFYYYYFIPATTLPSLRMINH